MSGLEIFKYAIQSPGRRSRRTPVPPVVHTTSSSSLSASSADVSLVSPGSRHFRRAVRTCFSSVNDVVNYRSSVLNMPNKSSKNILYLHFYT